MAPTTLFPSPPTKEELPSFLVQQISKSCTEVPDWYIQKDGVPQATDSAAGWWKENLVIDFSLLSSSEDELRKFMSALSEWGCFQVVNHGITSSTIEMLLKTGDQFFSLPLEEKLKTCSESMFKGYGSDAVLVGNQTRSWQDRLYIGLNPVKDLISWPGKPENFGPIFDEVTQQLKTIIEVMLKAIARSLNLDEDCLVNQNGKNGPVTAKFNFYPPCSNPDNVLGAKPHTDSTTMTVLFQDNQVESLQVLKDDQWFKVPVITGALFINGGDFTEIMTNGIMKAVTHRVVTNPEKSRVSLAVFFSPDNNQVVGPVNELVNADLPQLYKRMHVMEYMKLFFQNYPLGKKALELVKINKVIT